MKQNDSTSAHLAHGVEYVCGGHFSESQYVEITLGLLASVMVDVSPSHVGGNLQLFRQAIGSRSFVAAAVSYSSLPNSLERAHPSTLLQHDQAE
jgi:hypothetical protein